MPRPPDASDDPFQRGGSIGRYLVLSMLGRGGMGDVYAAYDPELDRRVALKLLRVVHSASRERMLREARALAKLSHPNVVQIYDAGEHHGDVYLAMELVDGETLDVYCPAAPVRPWREVLAAYVDAARGLAAAHAQGLIHRDVKPANILRGVDGRVRVADFGLVAGGSGPPSNPSLPAVGPDLAQSFAETDTLPASLGLSTPSGERMTVEGTVLGTPLYMAPEQHRTSHVTAASDQYSLCASLYEGLYGAAPFPVDLIEHRSGDPSSLLARKLAGIGPPPAGTSVPAWLHQAVARGLAAEPVQRFPTMLALVEALTANHEPARAGRKVAMGLVAVAAGAAVVGLLAHQIQVRRQLCSGGAPKLAEVWSDTLQERARAAFLATGLPYAEHAWTSVDQILGVYGLDWIAQYTETCEATRERGEQSEEVLDLRMSCLADHLQGLKASVDLFASADRQVVEKAVALATALAPVTECADIEALKAPLHPPRDPVTQAKVADLRAGVARSRALEAAGKYAEGLAEAERAFAGSVTVAYAPLQAEARCQVGALQVDARQDALAEQTLEDAFYLAEASRDDETAIRAATLLIQDQGVDLLLPAEGHAWARQADALQERTHAGPPARAELHQVRGTLYGEERKFPEAITDLQAALRLWEGTVGPEKPQVAKALRALGGVLGHQGKYDESLATLRRALAIDEKTLGPEHPDVAAIHVAMGDVLSDEGKNDDALAELKVALAIDERVLGPEHSGLGNCHNEIGRILWRQGKADPALAEFRKAIAINEKALGPEHPELAMFRSNVGIILWHSGRFQEAGDEFRRTLAIEEKSLGPNHPRTAETHNNLGMVLTEEGQNDASLAEFRLALAINEKTFGPEHAEVAKSHSNIGSVLTSEKRYDEALLEFQQALAIQEKTLGPDHPSTALTLGNMGEIDASRHAYRDAQSHLGQAIATLEVKRPDPLILGEFRFELAKAEWETSATRGQAVALARRARRDYAELPARTKEVAEIDTWLGHHLR